MAARLPGTAACPRGWPHVPRGRGRPRHGLGRTAGGRGRRRLRSHAPRGCSLRPWPGVRRAGRRGPGPQRGGSVPGPGRATGASVGLLHGFGVRWLRCPGEGGARVGSPDWPRNGDLGQHAQARADEGARLEWPDRPRNGEPDQHGQARPGQTEAWPGWLRPAEGQVRLRWPERLRNGDLDQRAQARPAEAKPHPAQPRAPPSTAAPSTPPPAPVPRTAPSPGAPAPCTRSATAAPPLGTAPVRTRAPDPPWARGPPPSPFPTPPHSGRSTARRALRRRRSGSGPGDRAVSSAHGQCHDRHRQFRAPGRHPIGWNRLSPGRTGPLPSSSGRAGARPRPAPRPSRGRSRPPPRSGGRGPPSRRGPGLSGWSC